MKRFAAWLVLVAVAPFVGVALGQGSLRLVAHRVLVDEGEVGDLLVRERAGSQVVLVATERGVATLGLPGLEVVDWVPTSGSIDGWMPAALRRVRFVRQGGDTRPWAIRSSDVGFGPVELFDERGALAWSRPTPDDGRLLVVVRDEDGDGDEELVVFDERDGGFEARGSRGEWVARGHAAPNARKQLAVCDLDGRPGDEIVFARARDLWVLGAEGKLIACAGDPIPGVVRRVVAVQRGGQTASGTAVLVGVLRRRARNELGRAELVDWSSVEFDEPLIRLGDTVPAELVQRMLGPPTRRGEWEACVVTRYGAPYSTPGSNERRARVPWRGVEVNVREAGAQDDWTYVIGARSFGSSFERPRGDLPPVAFANAADGLPPYVVVAVGNAVAVLK